MADLYLRGIASIDYLRKCCIVCLVACFKRSSIWKHDNLSPHALCDSRDMIAELHECDKFSCALTRATRM